MIFPWSCHVCAKQFDKYAGGICAKCKKSTCLKHLKLVGYVKDQGPARTEQITCVNCVRGWGSIDAVEEKFFFKDRLGAPSGTLKRRPAGFTIRPYEFCSPKYR